MKLSSHSFWSVFFLYVFSLFFLFLSPYVWPIHPACSSFEDLEYAVLDGEASLPVQGIGLPGVLDGSGSSDVFWCVFW